MNTTIAILLLALGAPVPTPPRPAGRATRVIPQVQLVHGKAKSALAEFDPVVENDQILTAAAGRARLVLWDGSILNVGAASQMTVKAAPAATQPAAIELAYGKVRAEVTKRMNGSPAFEIRTSTAVCGVLGTTLFVENNRDKKFSHVVNMSPLDSGSQVKVRSSDPKIRGEVTLNPGQGTLVYRGKAPSPPHVMGNVDQDGFRADTNVLP